MIRSGLLLLLLLLRPAPSMHKLNEHGTLDRAGAMGDTRLNNIEGIGNVLMELTLAFFGLNHDDQPANKIRADIDGIGGEIYLFTKKI